MTTNLFEESYKRLNQQQRECVDHTEGPLLVVAGPGTGKTELLALRVANIIKTTDAAARNILCLTFTESGALNMRERLLRYIGDDAYRVGIYTFHAFCSFIIAEYPEHFYNAANFAAAGDQDKARIMLGIFAGLPHGHPLASYHPTKGFVYLNDVAGRISEIKRAGFTVAAYQQRIAGLITEYEAIDQVLKGYPPGRNSIKRLGEFKLLAEELSQLKNESADFLALTLKKAIDQAAEDGKTTAIGKWKSKYTKTSESAVVFADSLNLEKINAVAEIYGQYHQAMHQAALFDFDDMIIDLLQALGSNQMLRQELEDQYHYILVDEFQDTNEAQMGIIGALTNGAVHAGKPNVMVVGDDDQAIYKFQGAELSNIINFRKSAYQDVKTVILAKNYRSHQDVLDFARGVIKCGENRLENHFADIDKTLSQGNSSIAASEIAVTLYPSQEAEFAAVAGKIKQQLTGGTAPEEIAILARNHRELQNLLPYLDHNQIPYQYSKRVSVFDLPHIRELITVIDYVASVNDSGRIKDEHLPVILSYPYFKVSRAALFDLALTAKNKYQSWSRTLADSSDQAVANVATLLKELACASLTLPLEQLLNLYIQESGFREYYFSTDSRKSGPGEYINFLVALRTLVEALREWRSDQPSDQSDGQNNDQNSGEQNLGGAATQNYRLLYARDLSPFVAVHEERGLTLAAESSVVTAEQAVSVITVHSAKGLEFSSVFVIGCHDKIWTRKGRGNIAPVPAVLSPLLGQAGDNEDDFIRLFYVAITRAKSFIWVSGNQPLLRYLGQEQVVKNDDPIAAADLPAVTNALSLVAAPYQQNETAVLQKLVENYKLPVTHLQNFLNVANGGPAYFIEQNLLRFPQPIGVSAAYGSAIHKALETFVLFKKQHSGAKPELSDILQSFTEVMQKSRLEASDYQKHHGRGMKVLTDYYNKRGIFFKASDNVEVSMAGEGIVLDGARVTGKLDFLREQDGEYQIVDFKTGRASADWNPARPAKYEAEKLHRYRQQLVFYQLLLDESTSYSGKVGSMSLEFVESILDAGEPVALSYLPDQGEVNQLKELTKIVYNCISNLNFPDVSEYSEDLAGVQAFEQDLLAGRYS